MTARTFLQSAFYKYHNATKHTVPKLLSSTHFLDWANQPDPFRYYVGCPKVKLPRQLEAANTSYFEVLPEIFPSPDIAYITVSKIHKPSLKFVSNLLFYSMAISAWKQIIGTNHRWALRVNPSSGNLHPTETHLLIYEIEGLNEGAYHYSVHDHYLELRSTTFSAQYFWEALTGCKTNCPPLLVCFTSIFWREAWKYQHRAFRYCLHDLGHALSALVLSAAILGWKAEIFGEFPDSHVSQFLGLSNGDEKPMLLAALRPNSTAANNISKPTFINHPVNFATLRSSSFTCGTPNMLSAKEIDYPDIRTAYETTCTPANVWESRREALANIGISTIIPDLISSNEIRLCSAFNQNLQDARYQESAHKIVRARRSAIDLDGRQYMSAQHLGIILISATRSFLADFQKPCSWQRNAAAGHYNIHLYLYIHRIDSIEAGAYYFDRTRQALILISQGDQRKIAKFGSCFQDIAAAGCFAVSMVADLNTAFNLYGNRCYRYLHFEAGYIGQHLYLASKALGYDATGIGCFIDDEINSYLKLPVGYEVIYNFTVGKAVRDPRLTDLPAYDFLDPTL